MGFVVMWMSNIIILLPCRLLLSSIITRLEWISNHKMLAIENLYLIIKKLENFYNRSKKLKNKFLSDLSFIVLINHYQQLISYQQSLGLIEDAMEIIVRCYKVTGIDQLSNRLNISKDTASLIHATVTANKLLDQGVFTAIVVKDHPSEAKISKKTSGGKNTNQSKDISDNIISFPVDRTKTDQSFFNLDPKDN